MLIVCHLIPLQAGIPPGGVQVRRITVHQLPAVKGIILQESDTIPDMKFIPAVLPLAHDSASGNANTSTTIPHRFPWRVCSIATTSESRSYIALPGDVLSHRHQRICCNIATASESRSRIVI